MNNIVKLIFNCISTGSGWADLKKNAAESLKNMNNLSGAVKAIGPSIGALGGVFGNALSAFLTGNIWAVAATGVKLVVDKLGLFKDRAAETKEKLDKLEEASRKFYETVNANAQKSIAKIDEETKRRNAQLDITNRMIKAELQLQKARAISTGDTQAVESIDRQMANADNSTKMQKARLELNTSSENVRVAEKKARDLEKAEREAEQAYQKSKQDLIESHWQDYRSAYKRAGGIASRKDFEKGFRFSEEDKKVLETYEKTATLAKDEVDSAYAKLNAEREKLKVARANVNALKAEQEAADAEANAKRLAEGMKAEKEKAKAALNSLIETSSKEQKAAQDFAESERARKKKEADEKRHREMEALDEEVKKRNEQRKKDLQKDIEANRQRAASLEQALGDAMERVRETHDVLGNAANMDQAGGVAEKRREFLTNTRFANGAADLIGSGKISQGKDGVWRANGRLSNLNQAILDRLNAEQNKKNVEKEQDKVVKKLDELIQKLEQMSTL